MSNSLNKKINENKNGHKGKINHSGRISNEKRGSGLCICTVLLDDSVCEGKKTELHWTQ